jgi:hypothetical protein
MTAITFMRKRSVRRICEVERMNKKQNMATWMEDHTAVKMRSYTNGWMAARLTCPGGWDGSGSEEFIESLELNAAGVYDVALRVAPGGRTWARDHSLG